MKKFNEESAAAINTISKLEISETSLVAKKELSTIEQVAFSIVLEYGLSGWAKVGFMKVGGFLFAFSGEKICWRNPVKETDFGFVVFDFKSEIETILENKISQLIF